MPNDELAHRAWNELAAHLAVEAISINSNSAINAALVLVFSLNLLGFEYFSPRKTRRLYSIKTFGRELVNIQFSRHILTIPLNLIFAKSYLRKVGR